MLPIKNNKVTSLILHRKRDPHCKTQEVMLMLSSGELYHIQTLNTIINTMINQLQCKVQCISMDLTVYIVDTIAGGLPATTKGPDKKWEGCGRKGMWRENTCQINMQNRFCCGDPLKGQANVTFQVDTVANELYLGIIQYIKNTALRSQARIGETAKSCPKIKKNEKCV